MAAAAVVSVSLLALSACGGDSDEETQTTESSAPVEESSEPADEPTEETSETEEAAPQGAEGQPAWALPPTSGGDLISTIEVEDVTVEVYQVGTTTATEDGNFADPDTNKPLLAKGDEIVFVNYVITNNGDPIDLGSSRVSVEARYDDWQWMQGMDSVTDDALFEEMGVNDDSLAPDGFNEAGVYTLGSGETYSYGENFKYQKNSPIGFEVTITPVDAEGELLHDDRMEGESTGTIA